MQPDAVAGESAVDTVPLARFSVRLECTSDDGCEAFVAGMSAWSRAKADLSPLEPPPALRSTAGMESIAQEAQRRGVSETTVKNLRRGMELREDGERRRKDEQESVGACESSATAM